MIIDHNKLVLHEHLRNIINNTCIAEIKKTKFKMYDSSTEDDDLL